MNRISIAAAIAGIAFSVLPSAQAAPARNDLSPARLASACKGRSGWTDPAPPARIFANTWYVGTCGISSILITGKDGHVLIDGGEAEAAPLVLANIKRAGFDPRDVRWIVASHEHYDHVGGLAALQKATGAKVAALPVQQKALESGKSSTDDPQFAGMRPVAPLKVTRTLADGDQLGVGSIVLTAHDTPVHAPGSTSWTWQSCDAANVCRTVTYADSASTISSDDYRFTDHPARVAAVRLGLKRMAALPCGVLLTPHPEASTMMERFAGKKPLVDRNACRAYAAEASGRFDARLRSEARTGKTK